MAAFRHTPTGDAIYECLRASAVPLTAARIHESVCAAHPTLALTTVYRTLERFSERGLVTREADAKGTAWYSLVQDHHHYLVCLSCNKRLELDECPLHGITDELEKNTGFDITRHQLMLYGYCPACRKNEGETKTR